MWKVILGIVSPLAAAFLVGSSYTALWPRQEFAWAERVGELLFTVLMPASFLAGVKLGSVLDELKARRSRGPAFLKTQMP